MKKTIKELRKEKGLTQQQLADIAGANVRTIGKWEHGDSNMSKTRIKFFANYFGIEPNELLLIKKDK